MAVVHYVPGLKANAPVPTLCGVSPYVYASRSTKPEKVTCPICMEKLAEQ